MDFDFVPLSESVTIRGKTFDVRGIDLPDIAKLIGRFGGAMRAMVGQSSEDGEQVETVVDLARLPTAALGAICASSVGKLGDAGTEAAFANLSVGEKATMLASVWRLTAPDGFDPFVQLLRAAGLMPKGLEKAIAAVRAALKKMETAGDEPSITSEAPATP